MTTLTSGLNTEYTGIFSASQGQVYFSNDFDRQQVWNGVSSTTSAAGMAAPAAAPTAPTTGAGNCTAGDHLIRYRYYNTKTLYVSNPSPSLKVTVAGGGQTLTFTVGTQLVASADSKCDQIIIEMTPVNSANYYRAGTLLNVAATAIALSIPDTTLIQGDNVSAITGDFGHEQPPLFLVSASHKGRMFGGVTTTRTRTVTMTNGSATVTGTGFSTGWAGRQVLVSGETGSYEIQTATSTTSFTLSKNYTGTTGSKTVTIYSKTPNRLYWTRPLYPEGWKPSAQARDVLQGRSDEFRGFVSYASDLYIFGRHSAERLTYTDDPGTSEGQIIPIVGNRGTLNQRCLVEADGVLYSWDRQGMCKITGIISEHISKPIDATLTEQVDFSQSAQFHGVFDPTDRVIMWFYVKQGDASPKYAACYEISTGRWWTHRWLQGITASAVVPDSEGQMRVLLGDENGYSWFYGISGSWDGLPPTAPSVVTISTGATTTVLPVNELLPISPSCAGCMLYVPSTGESVPIESNTANTITLATALTAAPADLSELWMGVIPFEYRTKWFVGPGQDQKKQSIYFILKLYPGTATGKLRVYFYSDFSSTPDDVTSNMEDVYPDGVTPNPAGSYMEVDMDGGNGDGLLYIPMNSQWSRSLQARIVSDRPDGDMRILDAFFATIADGQPTGGE